MIHWETAGQTVTLCVCDSDAAAAPFLITFFCCFWEVNADRSWYYYLFFTCGLIAVIYVPNCIIFLIYFIHLMLKYAGFRW